MTPENHATIRTDLKRLQYNQTYWDVTDPRKVQMLVATITRKEFLPPGAPCYLHSDGFFSHDPIYSALLAFGPAAPTLIGHGVNITRPISKEMYKGISSPAPLQGIPLFKKDLQRSFEDWTSLLSADGLGVVKFGHAGKDQLGRLKVKNVAGFVLWDTDEYKQVLASLTNFKAAKLAKRNAAGRDEKDERERAATADANNEERKKRQRVKGYGMLGLIGAPSAQAEAEEEMDVDDMF
jgi:hypothetical protein